jgi:single-stranded DNA-binding protein
MPSFSSCTLAGHLGKDAETRIFGDGKHMTSFSLALKDYKGETSWTYVKLFGKLAEWNADLKKGDGVVCSGLEYKVEEYLDKNNDKKRTHVFIGGMAANVVRIAKWTEQAEQSEQAEDTDELPF